MTHAYIADAVRTPRGRGNEKGSLKNVKPALLLAQVLRNVTDAIFGCVTQTAEQGSSVGTMALPLAGWSDAVSAVTINRYCASGLSATHFAALQALAMLPPIGIAVDAIATRFLPRWPCTSWKT